MIFINYHNESFVSIDCDIDDAENINERFSFYADNYFFHPKFKAGIWDGKLRLLNLNTMLFPYGMVPRLLKFMKNNLMQYEIDPKILRKGKKLSHESILKFCKEILKLPENKTPRDYQLEAIQRIVYLRHCTTLSATSSGKSLIFFIAINLLQYMYKNLKFLILVPTTQLVHQMESDFCEYGINFDDYSKYTHKVFSGQDKRTDKILTISTWQSLQDCHMSKPWFKQFNVVFVDEAHTSQGKELNDIVEACSNSKYKCGLTGTLYRDEGHKMKVESLFGPIKTVINSKDMIDRGFATKVYINGVVIKYPKEIKHQLEIFSRKCKDRKGKGKLYLEECKIIRENEFRLNLIVKLAKAKKNNSLILFRDIKYGIKLYETLKEACPDKQVFYIDGNVDQKKKTNSRKIRKTSREEVRKIAEANNNVIIVASYGTTSTGVNIKNIHYLFLAESMKSSVKVIQSIGRILRLLTGKNKSIVYDFVDDISYGKVKNFFMKHFKVRVGLYKEEGFPLKIRNILNK